MLRRKSCRVSPPGILGIGEMHRDQPWMGRFTSTPVVCLSMWLFVCLMIFRLLFVSWCNWKAAFFKKSVEYNEQCVWKPQLFPGHRWVIQTWHKQVTCEDRCLGKKTSKESHSDLGCAIHRARESETFTKPPCSSLGASGLQFTKKVAGKISQK